MLGSSRTSKRSSLCASTMSGCTFNSGPMPKRSISPSGFSSNSDGVNDSAAKGRTWSPIRNKHKQKVRAQGIDLYLIFLL